MPTTRTRTTKPQPTGKATPVKPGSTVPAPVELFPFAQYASVLGVYLILVGFTALFLPQMTRLFTPPAPRKTDRSQSEFMEALTADPSLTLCWILAGLAILEVWWANWMRKWSYKQAARVPEVEAKLDRVRFDSLHLTRLRDATAFTACAALAAHVAIVMLGAPLTTYILQTVLLALVIAVLTVFTPAFVLGSPSLASDTRSMMNRLTWTRVFVELAPRNAIEYAMLYPMVGTFAGGWLGAIPIALDWDRPWQAWPLTPLFGSLGGHLIGGVLALALNTTRWLATQHIQLELPKPKRS